MDAESLHHQEFKTSNATNASQDKEDANQIVNQSHIEVSIRRVKV